MSRSVMRRLAIQRIPRGYVSPLTILSPTPVSTTMRGDCCPIPSGRQPESGAFVNVCTLDELEDEP